MVSRLSRGRLPTLASLTLCMAVQAIKEAESQEGDRVEVIRDSLAGSQGILLRPVGRGSARTPGPASSSASN